MANHTNVLRFCEYTPTYSFSYSNISKERDIQLTNDNQIVSKPSFEKLQKSADQGL